MKLDKIYLIKLELSKDIFLMNFKFYMICINFGFEICKKYKAFKLYAMGLKRHDFLFLFRDALLLLDGFTPNPTLFCLPDALL